MTRSLIVGASGQDGAYLARLLLARGGSVAGTARQPGAAASARLNVVGVADAVVLHKFDAATASDAGIAALLDATMPDHLYYLAGMTPRTDGASPVAPWLAAIAGRAPAVRLFVALPAAASGPPETAAAAIATAAAIAAARTDAARFAVAGWLGAHESRLAPAGAWLLGVARAAQAAASGAATRLALADPDVRCDIGWAAEYVDAMTAMLAAAAPVDGVIATGAAVRAGDLVGMTFGNFGLDWRDHVDIGAGPAAPAAHLPALAAPSVPGWRADTWGQDLVDLLCDAVRATPLQH